MFLFYFFRISRATILQLPHLFTKEVAKAAAARTAEAPGARAAKPVAARAEPEGEEIKRLPEGAAWLWGEPADEACRQGATRWYRQVTITEKEGGGGEEDQPHPPLLCVGWRGNVQMAECG